MNAIPAAYPFVEVAIDLEGLQPIAQRSPGVIAVVGSTPAGVNGGTAAANLPLVVESSGQAAELFARVQAGVVAPTTLYSSLLLALGQDIKPAKIYGIRVAGNNHAAALASLEAVDDVTMVSLANISDIGNAAAGANPATLLMALKAHVETASADGNKRIGFAMVNPATARSPTYVADVTAAYANLKSDVGRMVLVAARGGTGDAATAAMAAVAGHAPHISAVLKKIKGFAIPPEHKYGAAEIKGLSEEMINPIIDPTLIVGETLHFADGRAFSSDAALAFIDIVRTLDDIDFRLKAGLIGMIGDARITKAGLTLIKARIEGILGILTRRRVITDFVIVIPILSILSVPEASRTPAEILMVQGARANRVVDVMVSVTYGPATHRLKVTLAPKF